MNVLEWPSGPTLAAVAPGFPTGLHFTLQAQGVRSSFLSRPGAAEVRQWADALRLRPVQLAGLEITGATAVVQDALLKILEEPPPGLPVIVYHDVDWRPLDTVVSRCFTRVVDDLTPAEKRQALIEAGVREGSLNSSWVDWSLCLRDLRAALTMDRGPLDELLAALVNHDEVKAFAASRGFNRPLAVALAGVIRGHLMGNVQVALARCTSSTLEKWAVALEVIPQTHLAVRYGILEVLSS